MDIKKPDVDARLRHLEQHFDIKNPTGSRPNAIALGHELANLVLGHVESFAKVDAHLSKILERLLGDQMGAVAGAVERTFHDDVGSSSDAATLRANAASKRARET